MSRVKPRQGIRAANRPKNGSSAWLLNDFGPATSKCQDAFNNDHATIVGTTLARTPGFNGGIALSGYTSAAYLTTTRNTSAAYTLLARFRHGGGGYCNLFSAVGTAYQLHGWTGGQFNFWTSSEFASGTNIGGTITANRWYTVAFVREGSSVTSGYKLYYDGALAGTANTGTLAAPTNPFWIGMRSDGFPQPWDGAIDYVMWFDRAFNPGEVMRAYRDPFWLWGDDDDAVVLSPPPPPPPSTIPDNPAIRMMAMGLI